MMISFNGESMGEILKCVNCVVQEFSLRSNLSDQYNCFHEQEVILTLFVQI